VSSLYKMRLANLSNILDIKHIKNELVIRDNDSFKLGQLNIDNVGTVIVTKVSVTVIINNSDYEALREEAKKYIRGELVELNKWDNLLRK